jgi:hypothetical protein
MHFILIIILNIIHSLYYSLITYYVIMIVHFVLYYVTELQLYYIERQNTNTYHPVVSKGHTIEKIVNNEDFLVKRQFQENCGYLRVLQCKTVSSFIRHSLGM